MKIHFPSSAPLRRCLLTAAFAAAVWSGAPASVFAAEPPNTPALLTVTLPFRVEIEEVTSGTLPALHSFCLATSNGQWLVFGGRVVGLHTFNNGSNNFPRTSANTTAYVIDPATMKVLGQLDMSLLGPDLSNPLTGTNATYCQDGDNLYVIGGYGQVLPSKDMVTFDTATRVQVSSLIQMIVAGETDPTKLKAAFTMVHDPRFKVTGSALKKIGSQFYLTFGHTFDGAYTISLANYNRSGGMQQKYTEKVRAFTLNDDMTIASFAQVDGGYDPSLPYNRRDLNVVDTIRPDGTTPGVTVYGGVFRAGQVAGLLTPIDIDAGATPADTKVTWVQNFQQGLSHYDCAEFTVFDPSTKSALTTLFGGISQFHYDLTTNSLIRDKVDLNQGIDGLPFIDSVSTIVRAADGTFSQYILPITLPALLGAETKFVKDPATPAFPNGVLDLSKISGRTMVGRLYGGIEAGGPYTGVGNPPPGSKASGRLFQVWLTPGASTVTPMPPIPPAP